MCHIIDRMIENGPKYYFITSGWVGKGVVEWLTNCTKLFIYSE